MLRLACPRQLLHLARQVPKCLLRNIHLVCSCQPTNRCLRAAHDLLFTRVISACFDASTQATCFQHHLACTLCLVFATPPALHVREDNLHEALQLGRQRPRLRCQRSSLRASPRQTHVHLQSRPFAGVRGGNRLSAPITSQQGGRKCGARAGYKSIKRAAPGRNSRTLMSSPTEVVASAGWKRG